MQLIKILKKIQSSITIEPLLFLYYLTNGLERPTTSGLWYHKVCMIMYNDDWTCDNINTNETLEEWEDEVQKVNSEWDFYDDICKNVPSMLVTFFIYGSVSDHISRKLPLAMPIIGNTVVYIIHIFAAVYIRSSGGFMLLASFIEGLSGGTTTIFMASMSYISDVSSIKSRTFRFSLAYGVMNIAMVIATSASGVLYEKTGFTVVYSLCICLNLFSFMYLIFGVSDIQHKQDESDMTEMKGRGTSFSCEKHVEMAENKKSTIKFCNFKKLIMEPILVSFKKRKSNNRAHILAILGVFALHSLSTADRKIGYLYLKGPPISLSQTEYGYYSAYGNLLRVFANLVVIPIMAKKFHIKDSILLPIALFSSICDMMIMAFSFSKWMAYLAPTVGFMQAGYDTFGRSILSTMVEVNEIGKIFSVMSLVTGMMSIFTSALYSYFLYPATVDIFAGFCYIFGSVVLLIPVAIAIWLHLDIRKQNKSSFNLNGEMYDNRAFTVYKVDESSMDTTNKKGSHGLIKEY